MTEEKEQVDTRTDEAVADSRVYELGYLLIPTIKEGDLERQTTTLKDHVKSAGGVCISEEAPKDTVLSYTMRKGHGGKYEKFDHAYFGSIKFEGGAEVAVQLDMLLKKSDVLLRYIIIKTVRENTRATVRIAPQLETAVSTPRRQPVKRVEEKSGPVSEEELDKSIKELVVE